MPMREYRCSHCGHSFDVLQKSTDPSPSRCPECQKEQLERMLSAPHYNLKGAGWYKPGMTR